MTLISLITWPPASSLYFTVKGNTCKATESSLLKALQEDLLITYAASVWSSTSRTDYRHLQVYQSKCLRVIGDFPWCTPISNLHAHLQMTPIRQFIYHLTDKFFVSCPAHPNPLISNTGNYTLEDLHRQYTKYRHKHIKHKLKSTLILQCFFLIVMIVFSLP